VPAAAGGLAEPAVQRLDHVVVLISLRISTSKCLSQNACWVLQCWVSLMSHPDKCVVDPYAERRRVRADLVDEGGDEGLLAAVRREQRGAQQRQMGVRQGVNPLLSWRRAGRAGASAVTGPFERRAKDASTTRL